ncbi:hypothetical protein DSO57_1033695 [Entomophthora muscae]|uniref:Uncharacterized protein n=1 Tax=Entomophthora muscae TaxID=34485 RepID=A0ACC2REQ8_9FUNG|nr:hypothetical protein DSO57_1033695 [Entomophthora muscae]
MSDFLKIAKLKATTQKQASTSNPPPVEPVPDPHIVILTDQVATLWGKIVYLHQHLSDQEDSSSESDDEEEEETTEVPAHEDHGCFPRLEGQPHVNCALALDNLASVTNNVADRQCCVWLQGTTSWRKQQEIFIKKDLRFEASLGLAFRAKLRAHTLISWK